MSPFTQLREEGVGIGTNLEMTYCSRQFSSVNPIPTIKKEEEGVKTEHSVSQACNGTVFSLGVGGGPCCHNPASLPSDTVE